MARYFFNLFNNLIVFDEEGADLPDLDAARTYAVANIRQMASADVLDGRLNVGHRIEILDDEATLLAIIYYREAVVIEDLPDPR